MTPLDRGDLCTRWFGVLSIFCVDECRASTCGGVPEIIMVVPAPNGELNPLVLAAAYLAGVTRVFTIGGAQAVAALAYGTETIPSVDKITYRVTVSWLLRSEPCSVKSGLI